MSEQDVREQVCEILDELFKIWDDPYKAPEVQKAWGQGTINEFARIIGDEAIERGLL